MEILQDLNHKGLSSVLVMHEHDVAQFAKGVASPRDGKLREDDSGTDRPRADDVLKTLPTLEV